MNDPDEALREFDEERRRKERDELYINLFCSALVLSVVLAAIYAFVKFVKWAWYN